MDRFVLIQSPPFLPAVVPARLISMKKELQRLTLKVRNEAPEEESLAKIRALRRELKTLDDEFRQFTAATPTSKPRVRGFKFPINNEHELERLESTVITNPQIRNQYVSNLGLGEWIFFLC